MGTGVRRLFCHNNAGQRGGGSRDRVNRGGARFSYCRLDFFAVSCAHHVAGLHTSLGKESPFFPTRDCWAPVPNPQLCKGKVPPLGALGAGLGMGQPRTSCAAGGPP